MFKSRDFIFSLFVFFQSSLLWCFIFSSKLFLIRIERVVNVKLKITLKIWLIYCFPVMQLVFAGLVLNNLSFLIGTIFISLIILSFHHFWWVCEISLTLFVVNISFGVELDHLLDLHFEIFDLDQSFTMPDYFHSICCKIHLPIYEHTAEHLDFSRKRYLTALCAVISSNQKSRFILWILFPPFNLYTCFGFKHP